MKTKKQGRKKYNITKKRTNKKYGGGSSENGEPATKRSAMNMSQSPEQKGTRIPGMFSSLIPAEEIPHGDLGLILNKRNNFTSFHIYQYNYKGTTKDIILIGEEHDKKPISFNMLDLLKILIMKKYEEPPEIYIEYEADIESNVKPVKIDKDTKLPVLNSDTEQSLKNETDASDGLNDMFGLSQMDILKYSGYQTIKNVDPRNLLLLDAALSNIYPIYLRDDEDFLYRFIQQIYSLVISLNVENCDVFESHFNAIYDILLRKAYIVNKYISVIQYRLENKTGVSEEELKGINLHTRKQKLSKLSTFVKKITSILINLPPQIAILIIEFFRTVYYEGFFQNEDVEIIMRADPGQKIEMLETKLLSFTVDLLSICYLEQDIHDGKNIVINLGNAHTIRLVAYLLFRNQTTRDIRNIFTFNKPHKFRYSTYEAPEKAIMVDKLRKSDLASKYLTTSEILGRIFGPEIYKREIKDILISSNPAVKEHVSPSFKGTDN